MNLAVACRICLLQSPENDVQDKAALLKIDVPSIELETEEPGEFEKGWQRNYLADSTNMVVKLILVSSD